MTSQRKLSAQKAGTKYTAAYAAVKIVFFNDRKTVASGPGTAAQYGKKGDCGDGARRSRGLPEVHPEACQEKWVA